MSINFEIICRLCIKHTDPMLPLFDDYCTLPQKIMMLIPALEIYAGDNLPTHVCPECADKIKSFDSFKLQCESSNVTLNEYLQSQQSKEVKTEKCEDWEISSDITSEVPFPQDHTYFYKNGEQDEIRKSIGTSTHTTMGQCLKRSMSYDNIASTSQHGETKISEQEQNDPEQRKVPIIQCSEMKDDVDAKEYKYHATKTELENEIIIADETCIIDDASVNNSVSDSSKMTKSPKPSRIPCQICGKMVVRKRFTSHIKTHTLERPYKCGDCGKMYNHQRSLKTHSVIHSGLKIHMCDICGKRFKLPSHLKTHYLTHTGQKSFVCDVCGKKFSQIGNLKTHKLLHTGEKLFSCDKCGKSFTMKNTLQLHLAAHAGQKEHVCDICGKGFLIKGNLTNHLVVHSGERRFSCDICGNKYAQRNSLKKHKTKHSRPIN